MKLSDFTYTASHQGYTVYYRGISIGGAMSLPGKRKHWKHREADCQMHTETAQKTIRYLIAGSGPEYMRETIKAIDKE